MLEAIRAAAGLASSSMARAFPRVQDVAATTRRPCLEVEREGNTEPRGHGCAHQRVSER